MDQDKLNNFLSKIAQIESANGKYTNHKTMQFGMHKGSSAIGTYGLMPNTINDMVTKMREEGNLTPEVAKTQDFQDEQGLKDYIKQNPQVERQLASKLGQIVLSKQPTEEQAAYSWNNGHNLTPQRITPDKLNNSGYVQKFRQLNNIVPINTNTIIPNDVVPTYDQTIAGNPGGNDDKIQAEQLAKTKAMMGI